MKYAMIALAALSHHGRTAVVARWSPGVVRLVMDGVTPARVPVSLITSLKAREVSGLIELPPPPPRFQRGDHVTRAARSVRQPGRTVRGRETATGEGCPIAASA